MRKIDPRYLILLVIWPLLPFYALAALLIRYQHGAWPTRESLKAALVDDFFQDPDAIPMIILPLALSSAATTLCWARLYDGDLRLTAIHIAASLAKAITP